MDNRLPSVGWLLFKPLTCANPRMRSIESLFTEAVSLQRQGNLDASAERLRRILRAAPNHVGTLQFLGGLEVLRGKLDEAVRLLSQAIRLHPRAAEPRNNLGMALVSLGRPEEAIPHYEAAIALDPRYATALNNLGSALSALDRHQEAVVKFEAALVIQPDFALARSNLGSALAALGKHDEAIAEHQRALEVQGKSAAVQMNMAEALQAAGRHDEALAHLAKAREFQPQLAAVHVRLGTALQELGRIDEARVCFEKAVELEPRRPPHYFNLVNNMRMKPDDPRISAMQALARAEESVAEAERSAIHFALGKALTDIGRPEQAFRHLLRANALKRQQVKYEEERVLGLLHRVRDVFSSEFMQARRGGGDPSFQPVFIIGMPRSGSTLIEQILASHPHVFAAGEVMGFRDAVRSVGADDGAVQFPESVTALSDAQLRQVATTYLDTMRQIAMRRDSENGRNARRITDKLPANFRFAGLIHLVLPNARIIHTCRDPLDTCLSCFATDFVRQPFTFDLRELGRYWRAYSELMAHWREVLPAGVMLDVRYESVVNDLEQEARRIIAHCGLKWHDACLHFQQADRPVQTASVVQVRQPIYRSSVGRWRPPRPMLLPLLEGLGMADDYGESNAENRR